MGLLKRIKNGLTGDSRVEELEEEIKSLKEKSIKESVSEEVEDKPDETLIDTVKDRFEEKTGYGALDSLFKSQFDIGIVALSARIMWKFIDEKGGFPPKKYSELERAEIATQKISELEDKLPDTAENLTQQELNEAVTLLNSAGQLKDGVKAIKGDENDIDYTKILSLIEMLKRE